MFGETTLALRAWMRAHGVARATDEKTPEDHIGLMLALSPIFVARSLSPSTTTCAAICSLGRRITWRSSPWQLVIPSTTALPSSRAPRCLESKTFAGFP